MDTDRPIEGAEPQLEAQEAKHGFSRRQLLAGGAGLAGVLAGAGLLGRGDTALAAPDKQGGLHFTRDDLSGTSMFLKLDSLKGESRDKQHEDEIDVLTLGFGGINTPTGTNGSTGQRTPGTVALSGLNLTKYFDRASLALFTAAVAGTHFHEAIITVRKNGSKPTNLLVITLDNVIVSSLAEGGSSGEDRLTENVTFNFMSIYIRYWPQNSDGSQGQMMGGGWDVVKGRPK